MSTDKRAISQWNRAQHAYEHYQDYIKTKTDRYSLLFADLVFIKNFKGGSATITEPVASLKAKLHYYEAALRACAKNPAFARTLSSIADADYRSVRNIIVAFAELPKKEASDISGFGSSFASTLLHFYFPQIVPILDKRALNGSGVSGLVVTGHNTVTNLLPLYPALIDECRDRLMLNPELTLRDLDYQLFIEQLRKPPFRRLLRLTPVIGHVAQRRKSSGPRQNPQCHWRNRHMERSIFPGIGI